MKQIVFADTYYFLALVNPRDHAHARALAYTLAFQGEMLTTCWVLTEVADAMQAPNNRGEFVTLLRDLRASPQMRILDPDLTSFDWGLNLFSSRPDKSWSLTDCISFAVMQREGIMEALTADRHFEQAGFVALLK